LPEIIKKYKRTLTWIVLNFVILPLTLLKGLLVPVVFYSITASLAFIIAFMEKNKKYELAVHGDLEISKF